MLEPPEAAPAPHAPSTLIGSAADASATPSLRTLAARGALINTGFTLALGVLGLMENFILAGFVSRADYGIWGVLIVTLSTLLLLKQVGIGDMYVQQTEHDQEAAFQKAFTLELGLSLALALLLMAVTPVLVIAYHLPRLIAPSAVLAATLVLSAGEAPQWIFYRRMAFARQRLLAAAGSIAGFVAAVGLAAAGAGYWAFVGGLAAGGVAAALLAVVCSPYRLRLRYEPGTLRAYAKFSGPLLIASAATLAMSWLALLTTKLALGLSAVGVVTLAATLQSFADNADQVVTGALYPAICAVRDRTELLYDSFVKTNRLALIAAVPFGIGLSLFSADIVRFGIGERWHPIVLLLEVNGVAVAVNQVGFNWTAYFRARGETRPIAIVSCAAAASFLLTAGPLLVILGLPGFAIGIVVQGAVAFVLRVVFLRRMFPRFTVFRQIRRALAPTVPAVAVVLLARVLEPRPRTVAMALMELAGFLLITGAATWVLESELLAETRAAVRGAGAGNGRMWLTGG